MINADQIIKYRQNQGERLLKKPFVTFFDSFSQCEKAAQAIIDGRVDAELVLLLERSSVISLVSAIECYYRDVLDGIFRLCNPEFVLPKLKKIHQAKYDIKEIYDFFDSGIRPFEIVVLDQAFQNTESIERVFSRFADTGFWNSILNQQFRRKDRPDDIVSWSHNDLTGLKATFEMRHELVHNPGRTAFMTDEVHSNMWRAAHMVWGSEVVLMQLIGANARPQSA